MFLTEKEDIAVLNDYLALNQDASPLLADALIYCFKYHPEKYNELIDKYGNQELSRVVVVDDKTDENKNKEEVE
jgi:ribonuclease HIII